MKYLIMSPVYIGSCIRDEFAGELEIDKLGLPPAFVDEIISWQRAYAQFIPMDMEQRLLNIEMMKKLDQLGVKIAKKLQLLIPGGAKVKYFSELKLEFLTL